MAMNEKARLGTVFGVLVLATAAMTTGSDEFAEGDARSRAGVYGQAIDKPVEEARDLVRYHLAAATWEKLRGSGAVPDDAVLTLNDYDDGSLRLEMNGGKGKLLEVVARFEALDGGERTRVEMTSDAAGLARAVPGVRPAKLEEQLRNSVEGGLLQIRARGRAWNGLSIVSVVNWARN